MSADTWASVRPTSGISPACSWRATRSAAAPAARRAAISAASLTIRSGPTTSTARRNSVPPQLRQQLDEEPGPHLVADGRRRRPGGELGDDRRRVLGLLPRPQREHARLLDDPRRLEPGDHHRRLAVPRDDEHRQPLQRHRLVAREVRQVAADRQQQDVDALVGHRLADPVEPVEVHDVHRVHKLIRAVCTILRSFDRAQRDQNRLRIGWRRG